MTAINNGPHHAHIEPTSICNLRCPTCINHIMPTERKGNLTLENLRKIVDKIATIVDISLLGMGEPLINPVFVDLAEEVKNRGIIVRTVTNGSLLHIMNVSRLLKALDELIISVDGTEPQTLQSRRPGLDPRLFWDNVKLVVQTKRELGLTTLLSFNVVINRKNVAELPSIIDKAAKFEINVLRVVNAAYFLHAENNAKRYTYERVVRDSTLPLAEQDALRGLAEQLCSKYGILLKYADMRPSAPNCWWPYGGIYITFDGFVTPCCQQMDPRVCNFGNVYRSF